MTHPACALVVILFGLLSGCRREPAGPAVTFRDLVAGLTNTTRIACLDAPSGQRAEDDFCNRGRHVTP